LLILNGNPPAEELLTWRLDEANHIVAVDGGWYALKKADLLPTVIIGDFDSCKELEQIKSNYPDLEIVHSTDQDTTDLEKAIRWVETNTRTKKLIILGGLGKRSDHFLSNLLISMCIKEDWSVVFDDDHEWISRVTPASPLDIGGRKGSAVSILPLVSCSGVDSKGLKWELNNTSLSPGGRISQSNLCTSDDVEIRCGEGCLMVFLSKH